MGRGTTGTKHIWDRDLQMEIRSTYSLTEYSSQILESGNNQFVLSVWLEIWPDTTCRTDWLTDGLSNQVTENHSHLTQVAYVALLSYLLLDYIACHRVDWGAPKFTQLGSLYYLYIHIHTYTHTHTHTSPILDIFRYAPSYPSYPHHIPMILSSNTLCIPIISAYMFLASYHMIEPIRCLEQLIFTGNDMGEHFMTLSHGLLFTNPLLLIIKHPISVIPMWFHPPTKPCFQGAV